MITTMPMIVVPNIDYQQAVTVDAQESAKNHPNANPPEAKPVDSKYNPYGYADYIFGLEKEAAEKQFLNETTSAQKAMDFSASEAEKLREWQKNMSNSAYQRAVQDLKKAGLNPALALGGPASTPSGAMATAYTASSAKANFSGSQNVSMALRELAVNSASKVVSHLMDMIGEIVPG